MPNLAQILIRLLAILWASPYTLLGLLLGFIGLCTGGHARIRGRVVEFYGGGVKWLLHRFPNGQFTLAFWEASWKLPTSSRPTLPFTRASSARFMSKPEICQKARRLANSSLTARNPDF